MKERSLAALLVCFVVASIGLMVPVNAYQGEPTTAHLAITTPTIDSSQTLFPLVGHALVGHSLLWLDCGAAN